MCNRFVDVVFWSCGSWSLLQIVENFDGISSEFGRWVSVIPSMNTCSSEDCGTRGSSAKTRLTFISWTIFTELYIQLWRFQNTYSYSIVITVYFQFVVQCCWRVLFEEGGGIYIILFESLVETMTAIFMLFCAPECRLLSCIVKGCVKTSNYRLPVKVRWWIGISHIERYHGTLCK